MIWVTGIALALIVIGVLIVGQILEAIKDEIVMWSRSNDAHRREMERWLEQVSAQIADIESRLRSSEPPASNHEFD